MKTLSCIKSICSAMKSVMSPLSVSFLLLLGALPLAKPCTAAEWRDAGTLVTPRYWHTATLLKNGQVLLAGGSIGGNVATASAELYDPRRNAWKATGGMTKERINHTATRLPDGKVLVAGGGNPYGVLYPPADEIYDPMTRKCRPTGKLLTPRDSHTATLLKNGKVLIAGGYT